MTRIGWRLGAVCLLLAAPGCSKNPGTLSKGEVEAEVQKALGLSEITLAENPAGGFTGTGRDANGSNYTLTVTQEEKERKLSYKATDDKGQVRGGFIKHYGR